MKSKVIMIARYLLGLIFFVFGLNGFLQFLPQPPVPENMANFVGALMGTGFFMQVVKGVEVICGICFLSNKFVPLAAVVLAPVVVNIFLIHAFMAPSGLPVAILCVILLATIGYGYKNSFKGVLNMNAKQDS